MEYEIQGTRMPVIELTLSKDESVYAQSGVMRWMDEDIAMEMRMEGGFFSGLKRVFGPWDIFTVEYTARREGAKITFGHTYNGKFYVFDTEEKGVICQKRCFLCATDQVTYDTHIHQKMSARNFGAEGFVMDKFQGRGQLIVEFDGECIERELNKGESIKVDPAAIGAFEETTDMSIEKISKGVPSRLAGEGGSMSLATLKGPGRVWLQTMPVQGIAGEISKYLPVRPDPR